MEGNTVISVFSKANLLQSGEMKGHRTSDFISFSALGAKQSLFLG